jgi:hypothetical protein
MHDTPHDPQDTLPDGLIDALRGLDGPAALPSVEHDDALLAQARAHLADIAPDMTSPAAAADHRRRSRVVLGFVGAGGAVAAAAVTFAVWFGTDGKAPAYGPTMAEQDQADATYGPPSSAAREPGETPSPGVARQPGPAVAGDVDGSGTLDILDAFALARAVERDGGTPTRDHDFNGDGRVDRQDADWLAQRAVSLDRSGGRG